MELRPWLLWVVAAAGALVLLAADARGQKIFTNTWAVHIPGGLAVADSVARKHGFHNLGQVGSLLAQAGDVFREGKDHGTKKLEVLG